MLRTTKKMASAELFNLAAATMNQFNDNNKMDTLDELKLFDSLDLNGSNGGGSSSGIGGGGTTGNNSSSSNSSAVGPLNGDLMDGALEDSRSMSEDADQDCKICK